MSFSRKFSFTKGAFMGDGMRCPTGFRPAHAVAFGALTLLFGEGMRWTTGFVLIGEELRIGFLS